MCPQARGMVVTVTSVVALTLLTIWEVGDGTGRGDTNSFSRTLPGEEKVAENSPVVCLSHMKIDELCSPVLVFSVKESS